MLFGTLPDAVQRPQARLRILLVPQWARIRLEVLQVRARAKEQVLPRRKSPMASVDFPGLPPIALESVTHWMILDRVESYARRRWWPKVLQFA